MQWVDWVILIVIGLSAGISLLRGFVREALSLAGWIIAFFVAKGFYKEFSILLEAYIETPSLRLAVSWLALFFLTLTATGLVNYIIGQLVEKAGLSGMDRVMGMAFWCAKRRVGSVPGCDHFKGIYPGCTRPLVARISIDPSR